MESPDLPGYGVHVRITSPTGRVTGSLEPDCLAEAACFSGALPGRTETVVRVVGPKPNGLLWPTAISATPSRVEVWIRRLATGELRYYDLPSSDPEDHRLPGLFDRSGFEP